MNDFGKKNKIVFGDYLSSKWTVCYASNFFRQIMKNTLLDLLFLELWSVQKLKLFKIGSETAFNTDSNWEIIKHKEFWF